MEKCPNCGAAVRSGAKFCTSCGTRLIDPSATATAPSTPAPTEETQIAAPAAQPEAGTTGTGEGETSESFAGWRSSGSSWGSTEGSASTPADRFGAALDSTERESTETTSDEFGWGKPAPATDDRFASWSAAYGTTSENEPAAKDADTGDVVAVESATIADEETESTATTDSAGFTEGGANEVDYLSGDENIEIGGPDSGIAAGRPSDQADARQRATTLVEELRELIWKIGEQTPASTGDTTDIRNALSAARGHVSDFSDLEGVITAVCESPRDIDALRELGGQAPRLEELLVSHSRLTAALDDAIRNLQ